MFVSACVYEQEATRLGDSLAVGDEAISDALAIRDELCAHGQSVVHARLPTLLIVVGLAGAGCEREAKQRKGKHSADFHSPLLIVRDASNAALNQRER
jgi:hypothetical protein